MDAYLIHSFGKRSLLHLACFKKNHIEVAYNVDLEPIKSIYLYIYICKKNGEISTNMHGGNVVISKDIKQRFSNNNISKKSSLNGFNEGRLFHLSTCPKKLRFRNKYCIQRTTNSNVVKLTLVGWKFR